MHEMSLMESVRSIVLEAHRTKGFHRVNRIVLEIGTLAGVQPSALEFCFEVVMKGSVAEGASLEIDTIQAQAWCPACEREVPLNARLAPCPHCGGMPGKITRGFEMRVKGLDVS